MPIPIKLTDASKARLLKYLEAEHDLAIRDVYEPLQAKRNTWEDRYAGRVPPRRADWMSNVPVGLAATYTDATTARFLNTMTAYKPTFTVQSLRESSWQRVAKAVEQMVEFKVQREMRYYDVQRRSIFETCRLGTGAYLAPWVERYEDISYRKFGFIPAKHSVPVVQGIVLKGLPLRNLIVPGGYSEINELPWWSRKIAWTELELKMARADGAFDSADLDRVLAFKGQPTQEQQLAQERAGEETPTALRINALESWIIFDTERRDQYGRYIVTWHPESRVILRVEQDDYPEWPLFLHRYGPRDYGIFGLGVVEMADTYDKALHALINLLIDNFKIATMQCYKGRKGRGLRSDTDIYPGKLFLLDDPATDLIPFQMGTPFGLNPQFIRMVMDLSERRTGISDYSLGKESPTSAGRATATATLALIQEGQRRFDLCIRDIRQEQDRFGNYALRMYHKHLNGRVPYMLLGDKKAELVTQWLEFPSTPPQYAITLVSNLSNVAMNKEVAKQDAQQTMMLLASFYTQMVQLTMQIDNPMTPPPLKETLSKIREAAAEKFRSVLEVYGEPSPERYTDMFIAGVPPSLEGASNPMTPGMGAPSLPQAPGMDLAAMFAGMPQGPVQPQIPPEGSVQ